MSIADKKNFNTEMKEELPYVIGMVGNQAYAINCKNIDGIIALDRITVTPMVKTDLCVRGMIEHKGKIINLIDLRKLLGYKSHEDEILEINIEQRIKDHENWVNTLEKSVRERTEFTLTDNSKECSFGKWLYPALVTNNQALMHELKKIEIPHDIIHSSAKKIKQLIKEGKQAEALIIIERLRENEIKHVISLMRGLKETLSANLRDIVIVMETETGKVGVVFDSVNNIEQLESVSYTGTFSSKYVSSIKKRGKEGHGIGNAGQLVLELNCLAFQGYSSSFTNEESKKLVYK